MTLLEVLYALMRTDRLKHEELPLGVSQYIPMKSEYFAISVLTLDILPFSSTLNIWLSV